jgi:hypothetical protein
MVARTEKLHGHPRPCPPPVVSHSRVNDEVFEADRIYINVGGRASVPEMPGIHEVPFLTNSSMMEVDFLPEHLVIVGGSYGTSGRKDPGGIDESIDLSRDR